MPQNVEGPSTPGSRGVRNVTIRYDSDEHQGARVDGGARGGDDAESSSDPQNGHGPRTRGEEGHDDVPLPRATRGTNENVIEQDIPRETESRSTRTTVEDVRDEDERNENDQDEETEGRGTQRSTRPRAAGPRQTTRKKKTGLNTKAYLKIASLNINGRGGNPGDATYKPAHLNQTMIEEELGVLFLQETHFGDEERDRLNSLHGRNMEVFTCSTHDNAESNSAGIAMILNKAKTGTRDVKTWSLIPGRAMLVQLPWHQNKLLTILCVYAPNSRRENEEFWIELTRLFETLRLPKIDMMLGDFNLTEDKIDRYPETDDNARAIRAFRDFKGMFGTPMVDGWRGENPDRREYTWKSKSRIDRIYTTATLAKTTREWRIEESTIKTDHRMVSAMVTDPSVPYIGEGRKVLNLRLLKDKKFTQKLAEEGTRALQKMIEAEGTSAQRIFKTFKGLVMEHARQREKETVPKIDRDIQEWEAKLEVQLDSPDANEDVQIVTIELMKEKIRALKTSKHANRRMATAVKNALEGETVSKYWSNINKAKKTRDIMYRLNIPDTHPLEQAQRSDKMAEVARNYHNNIQTTDIPHRNEINREDAIQEVLANVEFSVPTEKKAGLNPSVTEEEIEKAIRKAENGRAPGLDGFAYEIWKWILAKFQAQKKEQNESDEPKMFDVLKMLQVLFNNIATQGVDEESDFAEGWMCPIYKKGNKEEIANYRPITLLNTEYKIYSKILTEKLKTVAPQLIHMDQAGFVEGRSIADQILLARSTLEYGEIEGINGAIVALDQEKAYDKIAHDYLWRALRKFGIPENFITTVRKIYEKAETRVMINGVLSEKFKVTRGVRQGDPLSCLLFNLAIEPLACMLRKSTLRGIHAEGATERVIVKLFADDTAVTLAADDDFRTLTRILDKWCLAARAKFNNAKTEIVPYGTESYRKEVFETRKLNPQAQEIPAGMHIVKDKQSIRYLGGRIGNGIEAATPWTPILEKVETNLERWGQSHPTMQGRKIVSQYIPAGMTQYMTMVQSMPKAIEKELVKIIRSFMWDSPAPSKVDMRILYDEKGRGGLNLVDIESRNEAIELMKLKTYLNHGEKRASWAFLIDKIIKRSITANSGTIGMSARYIPFAQQWKSSKRELPKEATIAKNLLTSAEKHGVAIDTVDPTEEEKNRMPLWYHIGTPQTRATKMKQSTIAAVCLRKNHKVLTVGEAKTLINRLGTPRHKRRRNCACDECKLDRTNKNCENPHKCCELAATMVSLIEGKWAPIPNRQEDAPAEEEADQEDEDEPKTPFRRHTRTSESIGGVFRCFMSQTEASKNRQKEPAEHRRTMNPATTITAEGIVSSDATGDPIVGAGAQIRGENNIEIAIRMPKGTKYPEVGNIWAIREALTQIPDDEATTIRTTNKRIIDCLTTRLGYMEDTNWSQTKHGDELRKLAAALKKREGKTYLTHIRKKTDPDLGKAKSLAKEGLRKPDATEEPTVAREHLTKGVHMQSMTQNEAYKIIKQRKQSKVPKRKGTSMNIERAKWAIKESTGKFPNEEALWKDVRSPSMRINIRAFFWKMMHDAQKLGKQWDYSQTPERGNCPECGGHESMEHILLDCSIPGQEMLWNEVRALWEANSSEWTPPTMGRILACGSMKAKPENAGATRLQIILISETAFLLWKLRNERRIAGQDDPIAWQSEDEIMNRWKHAMNSRLIMDRAMANPTRYGKKALQQELVAETWKGTLMNEETLPADWVSAKGVLAGIKFGHRT